MPHAELPYVAFLAAFLVLVPLPWHLRARNVATLALVAWLFVMNMIYGIDAIIWNQSIRVTAVIWCDITSRIIIGASIALPAACMCISIHLAQVASATIVHNSKADKRRRQIIELIMCFGVPLLWMGLHYTVQGHRFDIIEDYGCRPNTYISIPSILLIWVPPLIFSTITVVYSALALAHFLRHRVTFARVLQNSNSGLTTSRYLRLMAMAFAEIVVTVISTSITLWFTTLSLRPWTNWADVHWNFSRIDTYPTLIMPPLVINYYYATWYIVPFSSLVFFVFFAFGQDAMREYAGCTVWIRDRVLCYSCARRHGKRIPPKGMQFDPSSFYPLPSASIITGPSLPSYQSAVATASDVPPSPIEKDLIYTERYAAEPIDCTDIEPAPLRRLSTPSDGLLSPATSAPPALAGSSPSPPLITVLTHPHDIV